VIDYGSIGTDGDTCEYIPGGDAGKNGNGVKIARSAARGGASFPGQKNLPFPFFTGEKPDSFRENGWNPRADARGDAPGVDPMAVRVYTRGWSQTRWTSARGAGRGDERAAGRAA
jgi:hypothetical protein